MKKSILIFDEIIAGHHLEYIHHLYLGAVGDFNNNYVFLLSPDIKNIMKKVSWPISQNITIAYISDKEANSLINKKHVFRSLVLCSILRKAIDEYKIDSVFLISLMGFMPFLPFFLNKRVKVSGIIYLIYLYRWNNSNLRSRIGDVIKYIMFSQSKIFKNIFLLNDNIAPLYLNRKFNTTVFKYLPDPFMPIQNGELKNLRTELNIAKDKIVCLHFGALTERKGTLEILNAILGSNEIVMSKCCFIFAGKIYEDIKESFYLLVDKAVKKTQIIIFDDYCDYDFIGSLCITSNYIVIPYKNSEQSSGVLGYAAQFKIPVIGPNSGLLGKLIKNNKLGYLLKNSSFESLIQFFNSIESKKIQVNSNYIVQKTVPKFVQAILNHLS